MSKSRLIELLAKRASGEITLLEQQELMSLIENSEPYAQLTNAFEILDKSDNRWQHVEDDYFEKRWSSLQEKLKNDEPKAIYNNKVTRVMKPLLAVAAVLAVVVMGVLFLMPSNETTNVGKGNIVSTKKGSRSYTVLPDGTQVWLNSDTKISYGKSFGSGAREVTLTGEAYFDVVKDASLPFIVHTSAMDITVLGTAFNVSAYDNDVHAETTLIRGSVEVSLKKYPDKKVMLKPFEKVSVLNNAVVNPKKNISGEVSKQVFVLSKINKIESDSGSVETQWVKNRLVFEDNTLEDIAERLSRWYDVTIIINSETLKKTKYRAEFDDASLGEAMQSLKLSGNFNYTIDNKVVTISPQ
ncbi:MAG: DUF4974 domain-containing protein [Niabella sp.]